jgi:hypothetical protein
MNYQRLAGLIGDSAAGFTCALAAGAALSAAAFFRGLLHVRAIDGLDMLAFGHHHDS